MSKKRSLVRLRPDERLSDIERQATSMSLPSAIHHRLDLLASCARDVAASRAEIIGMLIAGASLEAAELEAAILRYRKLTVAEVIPDEADKENVIAFRTRGPGRPARDKQG